jgi:DNA-binding NtrC family response regulator
VRAGCLQAAVLFGAAAEGAGDVALAAGAAPKSISLDDRLKEVESNLIGWALKVSDGNKSKAAELLSIKRSTLGDRISRCGLVDSRDEEVQAAIA